MTIQPDLIALQGFGGGTSGNSSGARAAWVASGALVSGGFFGCFGLSVVLVGGGVEAVFEIGPEWLRDAGD